MIATFQQFDASFPVEDTHQSFLLNRMMKSVADFSLIRKTESAEVEAILRHAESILELNDRSKIYYSDIIRYFNTAISFYNSDQEQFAAVIEQISNNVIVEKIEFYKSKAIQIELINRPVFESFEKFEKKAKAKGMKHHKVHSALTAITEYKNMCIDHGRKAHDFIAILNQFVVNPSFPNGQSVLSKDYINSLVESSGSYLESIH